MALLRKAASAAPRVLPLVLSPQRLSIGVSPLCTRAATPPLSRLNFVASRGLATGYHNGGSGEQRTDEFPWWSTAAMAALGGAAALLTSSKAAHAAEVESVYERETGISFPKEIQSPPFQPSRWKGPRQGFVYKSGKQGVGYYLDTYRKGEGYLDISGVKQHLVGVGMRCMLQRCDIHLARAYAIGLYLDHSYTQGFSPANLTDPRLRKTLRLVMAREVKGGHIGKGFDRTLIPKMRQKTGKKQGPGKEALKVFNSAFNRCGTLGVGAEVHFVFGGDDTISIYIEGVAVMEMYVGDKPVGPLIKSNIVQGYQDVCEAGLGKVEVPAGTQPTPA